METGISSENVLQYFYNNEVDFVSSVITVEEYLVFPYKIQSQEHINLFENLIETLEVEVVSIDNKIAKQAAQIRAEYKSFKAMDALQLAVVLLSSCDLFLTNDKQLKKFREIKCITVDELGEIIEKLIISLDFTIEDIHKI